MYTGYNEELLEKMINLKEAIKLRDELIRKGEVLPATEDVVFKNLIMESREFLIIILEHFLGINKEVIRKNMHLENFLPLPKNSHLQIACRIFNSFRSPLHDL